ncbi:homeobox protein cut [Drosophila obscura]|uniref:homeobox protein cut n=1 Tax=Drosophila obscura TaxID=7282 RepID=UPI001BB28057|nr:homeobox protein cut [Drosophila obscura]
MLAPVQACLALLAVISQQELLLQAAPAPFPAIENAAFTSQDLLAEESAAIAWQPEVAPALSSHVQHKRHRRHHEDSRKHHHKRHWDHHSLGPSCHHGSHEDFGPDFHHHGPPNRFHPYPNGFGPFPGFGPPGHDEQQRPFEADLEPFKDNNGGSRPDASQTRTSSQAPPTAAATTSTTTPAPPSSSTTAEDYTLAIDIRIG